MIVAEEELVKYLGNNVGDPELGIRGFTLEKLRRFGEHTIAAFNLPPLDYLFLAHQLGDKGINELAEEAGISTTGLKCIFNRAQIPKLAREEVASRNARLKKGIYGLTKLERQEYGRKAGKIGGALGGRRSAERRVGIHDPINKGVGGRIGGKKSAELKVGIFAPDFDTSYRRDIGKKRGRRALEEGSGIHDPQRRNEYLHTYHGFRRDIGFDARSMWEANLARVLIYLGFDIKPHVPITLDTRGANKELFKLDTTECIVDFLAVKDGKAYLYEIVTKASYRLMNNPRLEKLRLLREQHSGRSIKAGEGDFALEKIIAVDERKYYAFGRAFAAAINADPKLTAWETINDNLKTNPQKYV